MTTTTKQKESTWDTGYLNRIIISNNVDSIKSYIIITVKNSKRSIKPFNFYIFLTELYANYPELVKELIYTLPEWGCWKEMFVLLLAIKNRDPVYQTDLNDYIYNFIAETLQQDFKNYKNRRPISNLAKWIPRQQKSFDKKLDFVTNICKHLYDSNQEQVDFKNNIRRYRKLVADLNKHLDTTEIKLCAREYDKIDFSKVPVQCLKKHMPTFLKHEESKQNLEKYMFKEMINLSTKQFFDKIIYDNISELDKNVMLEVWAINKHHYKQFIKNQTGVNLTNCDLVIDLSKSMYNKRLISLPVAAALVCTKSNIIVNSNNPYILKLDNENDSNNLFDNIDTIKGELNCCPTINIDKILSSGVTTNKRMLILTDKHVDLDSINCGNKQISVWTLDSKSDIFKVESKKNIVVHNNVKLVKDLLDSSEELKRYNILWLLYVVGLAICSYYSYYSY